MADFVGVAKTNELDPGQGRRVEAKGKQIALFNIDGKFFAVDNTCTHRGGPLAEGAVSGHAVACPHHGATFDVRTGEVLGPPAQRAVACYGVRVTGTDIEVEVQRSPRACRAAGLDWLGRNGFVPWIPVDASLGSRDPLIRAA